MIRVRRRFGDTVPKRRKNARKDSRLHCFLKGYFKFNWKIGILPEKLMDNVRRDCCGTTFAEVLITKLKSGERIATATHDLSFEVL